MKPNDNPNFWKTHLAAASVGALLGIGVVSNIGLDTKEQDDEVASFRKDLSTCFSDKLKLAEELETLKNLRRQDFETVTKLRDENRDMNTWMEWMRGQEKKLMTDQAEVQECIDQSTRLSQIETDIGGLILTETDLDKIAALQRKGCIVQGITQGKVQFTSSVNCDFAGVNLENKPDTDYINRDVFGRELSKDEEEIVGLFEGRKYDDVIDKVSPEMMRKELQPALTNSDAPEEAGKLLNGFIDQVENYKKNPGSKEARCKLLTGFMGLEEGLNMIPNSSAFFKGAIFLSFVLESFDEGGATGAEVDPDDCKQTLGIEK